MKKIYLLLCIIASLLILVSASIWEGASAVCEDLPETGLYMSTSSFPINSVVEVTNLENGRTTRLIVYSGLDSAGFLALLSRDAANALDISEQSLGRIRMSQVSDLLALSRFTEGRVFRSGDDTRELALVPVEPRPPVDEVRPDPSLIIPPVTQAPIEVVQVPPVVETPPVVQVPPVVQAPPVTPVAVVTPPPIQPPVTASRSAFSAPTIRSLQAGQYYLQIAAYSNAASVNPEIARLDNRLPVAVMDAGTPQSPLYRILIGPLTLGEAGAMLHRFRNTHSDAFVRLGE